MGDDDDDFIVPSDSELDVKSLSSRGRSSSRASRRTSSSRLSGDDEFTELGSDFEDEDEVGKSKSKTKTKKSSTTKTSPNKTAVDGFSAPGGASFLTAAEQRAQGKKNEKQTSNDAFAFLKDPRDVSLSPL